MEALLNRKAKAACLGTINIRCAGGDCYYYDPHPRTAYVESLAAVAGQRKAKASFKDK